MTFELKWEKPSQELVDRLYKELGMTRESVKEDVRLLSQWLSKQPHLPKITDEDLMERFLFNCKNSLEVAKTKMDLYYTVRATMPEYFIGRDPTDPNLRQNMLYAVLPKLSDDGCRIILVKLYDKDPANFQPLLANKTALMVLDILLRIEKSAGYQVIYDPEGLTLAHTGAVTIRMTKNFFQCALSAFPQRVKGIHIINSSPVTVAFINFNKMFLKEKIKNRMHIHAKGSETLFDHIPKNILPKEFGGTYPHSMDQIRELTQKQTAEHRNLFIKEENLVADLSKKPENEQPAIQEAQLFGLQGSFRHMHID